MGSYSGASEIVEVKEELRSVKHSAGAYRSHSGLSTGGHDRKPPVLKLGLKDSLQNDINHLFESISIKNSSKSLDLTSLAGTSSSPIRRNAMKRPITVGAPQSPGMGIAEPVSLKQALRELCLSKASEMAAMKRLSLSSSSPGGSEAGRIKSLYNSVVVDTSRSGLPIDGGKGTMVAISLVPEESKSDYSGKMPKQLQVPKMKSFSQSAQSSPRIQALKSPSQSVQSSPRIPAFRSANQSAQTSPRVQSLKSPNQSVQSSPRFTQDTSGTTSMQNDMVSLSTKVGTQTLKLPSKSAIPSPKFAVPQLVNGIGKIPSDVDTSYVIGKVEKQEPKSPTISSYSSPRVAVPASQKNSGAMPLQDISVSRKVGSQASKTKVPQKQKNAPVISDNMLELDITVSTTSTKVASTATASRSGRKGRLHSAPSFAVSGNRINKLTRNTSRVAKPNIRTKGSVKKKIKRASTGSSKEGNNSSTPNKGQLVCQKCQCTLKNAIENSDSELSDPVPDSFGAEVNSSSVNADVCKPEWISSNCNRSRGIGKAKKNSKSKEKGEFSQSSKSSLGDYSTSTSNSDESNASRPSCSNRPHMSKDARWEAVRRVKKQHGVLSLRHFNLLKKLGCGDIGTVYLAELIGSNCLFAIKVMDNEFLARRKKMPRAQTEREILRMLDHPFLPTLYSQFTSDNLSGLVMEFCPGGDLHVLRQKQPGRSFSEQAARFYVAEVLLALEYLHMLGVIYRDLKPENILVREDGHIMLTDFDLSLRCSVNPTLLKSSGELDPARMSGPCRGTSCIDPFCVEPTCQVSCFSPRFLPAAAKARKLKAEAALHVRSLPQLVAEPTDARSNSFVGTHEYLAPEIIKGEGHGAAVDWWTFGVFLYELIYGITPFKGCGNEETLCNVVTQSLMFPDSPIVSFQARDLIRGLLVKEPENRLGSQKGAAEIKQHPFFQGLNWALIRCAAPPELPESNDFPHSISNETGSKYLEYKPTGEHLEFELF